VGGEGEFGVGSCKFFGGCGCVGGAGVGVCGEMVCLIEGGGRDDGDAVIR